MSNAIRPSRSGDIAPRFMSGLNILAGIWLVLAPMLLGYSDHTAPLWNDVLMGLAVGILACVRFVRPHEVTVASWINVAIGVWLILAPFVLGYFDLLPAMANDILLGLAIALLAASSALSTTPRRSDRAPGI